MNKLALTNYIRDAINRGTTLDAFLPTELAKAAHKLERAYNFLHMEISRSVVLTTSTTSVDLTDGLKRVELWRFSEVETNDSTKYRFFTQVDPKDPTSPEEEDDVPRHWHMDYGGAVVAGTNRNRPRAVLNFTPPAVTSTLIESLFTDYEGLSDTDEPWLYKFGSDLVLAEAILGIAPIARDPDLIALWTGRRDEALLTVYAADQEARQGSQDPFMSYRG